MVLETTGPRRVEGDRSIASNRNVGDLERLASVVGGGALALMGLRRRGASGASMALLGAELIRRGASGHCWLYDAVGVTTGGGSHGFIPHADRPASPAATVRASRSVKVERTIAVNRTPAELYQLWREPTNLPQWMEQLSTVERIDDRRAKWAMDGPAGHSITWESEVIVDVPNDRIAWKSEPGAEVPNAGSVHFTPLPANRGTEVRLVMDYQPPAGLLGNSIAKLLGSDPDHMIQQSLRRFKTFAETGETLRNSGSPEQ